MESTAGAADPSLWTRSPLRVRAGTGSVPQQRREQRDRRLALQPFRDDTRELDTGEPAADHGDVALHRRPAALARGFHVAHGPRQPPRVLQRRQRDGVFLRSRDYRIGRRGSDGDDEPIVLDGFARRELDDSAARGSHGAVFELECIPGDHA